MPTTRAFISYSWDNESHKQWVAKLAADLRRDGVETILDQWHVAPGDQLTSFMEREIRENDYVLIICTPNYRIKSDDRKGGVGYEGDIMTAEVHTRGNHKKFIPILAKSTWDESAPSWLKGKYYVDLRTTDNYEKHYPDLLATLNNTRPTAPPIQVSTKMAQSEQPKTSDPNEPVRIIGIIVDEITEPTLDNTPGSALYTIPFRLNRAPSSLWSKIFLRTWDMPPSFTSMHRPGIASVYNSKLVLRGTTIEEVHKYHRATLILCVDESNRKEEEILEVRRQREELVSQKLENHREHVRSAAKDLSFD